MDISKQDGVQVSFSVIETVRVHAQATISRAEFERETGIPWAKANDQDIAKYLVTANLPYEETSAQERLDDPVFIDLSVRSPNASHLIH